MGDIPFDNNSKYVSQGRFNWEVFPKVEKDVLNDIKFIRYILHDSFPEPVQDIYDRKNGFRLKSNGWGEFRIQIVVYFKSGDEFKTHHDLKLNWNQIPAKERRFKR